MSLSVKAVSSFLFVLSITLDCQLVCDRCAFISVSSLPVFMFSACLSKLCLSFCFFSSCLYVLNLSVKDVHFILIYSLNQSTQTVTSINTFMLITILHKLTTVMTRSCCWPICTRSPHYKHVYAVK